MPSVDKIEQHLTSLYRDDGTSDTLAKRIAVALSHPVISLAALRYVMRYPVIEVEMSRFEQKNARWMFNRRKPWRLRGIIASYIELPTPLDSYWRGANKQSLRRRTHKARASGYTVKAVHATEIIDIISQVFKAKGEVHEIERNLREMNLRKVGAPLDGAVCVSVFDQYETPVAFCLGTKTGNVVKTVLSCTSQKGTARWLCFSGFVEEVSARGGKFIVDSPPWAFPGGNQIFADHLGFLPARVRSA
jgi:hypothetical protein